MPPETKPEDIVEYMVEIRLSLFLLGVVAVGWKIYASAGDSCELLHFTRLNFDKPSNINKSIS